MTKAVAVSLLVAAGVRWPDVGQALTLAIALTDHLMSRDRQR